MPKVITGEVRFSYAHVFEPSSIDGNEPKYSVSVLVDKDDTETIDKIEAAIKEAIEEGKKKFGDKFKGKLKLPLRDGDEERPDDEAYENKMFFNASSKNKPQIVDASTEEIMGQDQFYSGVYGRASINFYPFNAAGNKGVAAGLNNLQTYEKGDRLSGGSSAQEDFGDDLM